MKLAPRSAWLIPVALLAVIWACALLGVPRYPAVPSPTQATTTSTPALLASAIPAAIVPKPSSVPTVTDARPDWSRLATEARVSSIQWQQRVESLARQTSMPLAIPASDSAKDRDALVKARSDKERFEIYDRQGKAWRERALSLESLLTLTNLSAGRSIPPPPQRSGANGMLSDEEIAAQARANAGTYAPAVASSGPGGSSTSAKPPVDEASKTQHVRDYTRKDGTHVESYHRRPPSY